MTTATFASPVTNATDAEFRAWGGGLSAALTTVGLVKTADSGQINWATVLKPAAGNTQQGYEIWRFNDSLQATAPLFLRIGYGSASSVAIPAVWVTLGKGSDGAGNITGVLLAATPLNGTSSSSTSYNSYVSSGDGSMLGIVFAPQASTYGSFVFFVERSRAADSLTPTGTSVVLGGLNGGASWNPIRTFNYATGIAFTLTSWPVALPTNTTGDNTLAAAGKAPVFPAVVHDGAGNFWQPRAMMTAMRTDAGAFLSITVPGYGTYLSLHSAAFKFDAVNGTYASGIMWWE